MVIFICAIKIASDQVRMKRNYGPHRRFFTGKMIFFSSIAFVFLDFPLSNESDLCSKCSSVSFVFNGHCLWSKLNYSNFRSKYTKWVSWRGAQTTWDIPKDKLISFFFLIILCFILLLIRHWSMENW